MLHSDSQGWVEARVACIWPDVSVTVSCDEGNIQRHITAEAQPALLRPMPPGGLASPGPRLQHSQTRRSKGSGTAGMRSQRPHELTSAPGGAAAADGTDAGANCSDPAALPYESPRACDVQSKPGILRRGRSSAQRSESRRLRVTFSADSKGGSGFTGAVRSSPRPPASPSPRHRCRGSSVEVPTLSRSRGLTKLPTTGLACPDSPSISSRRSSGCSSSGGSGYIASQAMLVHSQSQASPWVEARVATAWPDPTSAVPPSPGHSTASLPQVPTTATKTPSWQPWASVSAVAPATSPSKVTEACVVLAGSRRRLPRFGGC